VARILIVAGGCRGRGLAAAMLDEGHAVRITTRSEEHAAAIEECGAECFVGSPQRLATMRAALDGVTILCWLLATASGPREDLQALHSTRLEFFLTQAIDTTVRGIVYESGGEGEQRALLADGERRARAIAQRNAIPLQVLAADPARPEEWQGAARVAIATLLAPA